MNYHLTNDQQRLITMYINQYNQTNNHIDQLLDMLDEIRNNIINVLSLGQPRRTRLNRHSRNSNTNINRFINQIFNERQNNFIHYDYTSPISPRVYNNTSNTSNTRRNNTTTIDPNNMSSFFTNFLNTTVVVRPTNEQIENASRLIRYRDIENPVSESCPILLDRFQPDQMVRQIIHCGHIFCQQEFQQWFENHVQCPVCRYDIRYYRPSSSSDTNNNSSNNNTTEPIPSNQRDSVTVDMSNNELSNRFVDNLASHIFQSLLFPQTQNDDLFMLDPSSNILFYETILRPNNRNNHTR
jgi:hypothetical protein